ncbi:MAG: hypothetical protein ABI353_16915 [Isosphaeraceae bacterium]
MGKVIYDLKSSTMARPKAIYKANIDGFLKSEPLPKGKKVTFKTAAPPERRIKGNPNWVKNTGPYMKVLVVIGNLLKIAPAVLAVTNCVYADEFDPELEQIQQQVNKIRGGLPNPTEEFLEREQLARMIRDYMSHFSPDTTFADIVYYLQVREVAEELFSSP